MKWSKANNYVVSTSDATGVMSDRQPIALIGHDGLELGAGQGDLLVYHLKCSSQALVKDSCGLL